MDVQTIDESLCLFSNTHLWLYPAQYEWLVGLSDFSQDQRSDLTYVELPTVGDLLSKNERCIVLESVKAAEEIAIPVSGMVTRVNTELAKSPQLVNQSPYGEGWLFAVQLSDENELDDLMRFADYDAWLDQ